MIVQAQDYTCDCSPLQQYYCFKNRAKPESIIHCGCSRLDQYCCSKSEKFCSSYLYASSEAYINIHNKRCVLIKNSSINIKEEGRFFSDTIKESKEKIIKEIRFAKQACIMCVLESIYDEAIELKSLYNEIKDLIEQIEAAALSHDKTQIVRILKNMVPEFISNNSIFEKLDH